MEQQTDRITAFRRAVELETKDKIEKLAHDIERYEQRIIDRTREEQEGCMFSFMQKQVRRIKSDTRKALTNYELDGKRRLLQYRSSLVEQVFADTEQQLAGFTKTKEYPAYLSRRLSEAYAAFPGERPVMLVRSEDLAHGETAVKSAGLSLQVRADDRIRLGGFLLLCEESGMLMNVTLEEKLQQQRPAFYEQCGLGLNR